MARPRKDGIDYFPLDTDLWHNKKIQLLRAEFGMQGVCIALAIMSEVYRTGGYYKKWDDDDCLLMSQGVAGGCDPKTISEVLDGCLRRSLFDRRVFEEFGVITSLGIQKRFLKIVTNSRDIIPVISEYWLLGENDYLDVPPSAHDKIAFRAVSSGSEKPVLSGENHISQKENHVLPDENPVSPKENSAGAQDNSLKESKENNSISYESTAETGRAPFDRIMGLYNSVCVSLPKVNALSKERAQTVSARYRDLGGSLDEMKRFFERAEASDFLTGRSSRDGRGWHASFDWIMKEANFLKIQEGNYDNSPARSPWYELAPTINGRYAPTFDIAEVEKMLDAEWFGED